MVPVYQRDYAWRMENCKKLWEDLSQLISSDRENHFLGTLVTINNGLGEYLVIDGQQRLTTITLFILALIHKLEAQTDNTEEENRLKNVLKAYIIDDESLTSESRIKLKPNKSDSSYFQEVLQKKVFDSPDSNIVQNYQYFVEILETNTYSLTQIFEGLKRLEIVSIDLINGQDDPQLIFESLNSTGVDLTDGDLIRNYILMDLKPNEQDNLYNRYWIKIERKVGDIAEFVRNFLMFKLQKNVTQTKRAVYNEFKKFSLDAFQRDSQKILETLLKYAEIYSFFVRHNKHSDQRIDENLESLFNLEVSIAYPFLFEIFDLHKQGILNAETVADIIHLVESHLFRRILVHNTTQGLNKLYISLGREIKRIAPDTWQGQYYDVLSFVIKSKTGSQKMPTNDEFFEALLTKETYKLRSKNRDFLLSNLENHNSSYRVDISDLSVEHIMPQTLTLRWKEVLGEDWEETHAKYLHTLGNLTLTAKNSELSNKDIKEKQKIDYITSKLKLSYYLEDIQKWNEEAIRKRGGKLAQEAIEIWQYPNTDFVRPVDESEAYVLDENLDMRNRKPKSIIIGDERLEIQHWWEVRKILCQKFYKDSPTDFKEMMRNSDLGKSFSEKQENHLLAPLEFIPGLFVEIHGSTFATFRFLVKLCEYFELDPNEVSFEIR